MTSVEQNPSAKHSWERESKLGDVSLQVFCNSAVHNRIDNDSENFQAIVKKAGSIDNLSIRDDDPGTIFVRIKIDLADDLAQVLEECELTQTSNYAVPRRSSIFLKLLPIFW